MKIYLLVILLGVIGFFILNIVYKKTNSYKNEIKQLEKFINGVPENLDIVNLGSSYARNAFEYKKLGINGFNFGLQPQSLSYDFRILKQYTPNLNKNCIVTIVLPNMVFGFLDYKDDRANTKYYYFLEPKYILNYSKIKYFLKMYFPLLYTPKRVYRIFKDIKKIDLEQDKNLLTIKEVKNEAKDRVKGWERQFNLKNMQNPEEIPEELRKIFLQTQSLLQKIINYCKENEFRPVVLVPPCSKIINDLISKEFLDEVLYKNILKSKGKILFLEYLKHEEFQDYKLYINSDMLNENGRIKFTKQFLKDLEKNGIEVGE